MKKLALAIALTASGMLGAGSVSAAILVIDHFDTGSDSLNGTSAPFNFGPSYTAGNKDVDVIGTGRTIEIVQVNQPGIYTGTGVRMNMTPPAAGLSRYRMSQDDGTDGTSTITWDSNGVGLGGADLTLGGVNDALQVNLASIDQGVATMTFDIYSAAGKTTRTLSSPVVGAQSFLFTSFDHADVSYFNAVNKIVLTISSTDGTDLSIELIQTQSGVPVPGTLALLGLGLMGVRLRRRKAA